MIKEKLKNFLLAVRRLEKEHGIYLETSEWLIASETEPEVGVFAATESISDTELLQALWNEEK